MIRTALLMSAFLLAGATTAFAKGHIAPSATPGVSDTYVFSGSEPNAAVRADDGLGSSTPGTLSMNQILYKLEDQGYSDVSNLQPVLGGYTALAVKDGKVMEVEIGNDGKVMRLR
jgi:hypothetical protein